jgi:alpha-tubulin suppressor-like RCC1 family protein
MLGHPLLLRQKREEERRQVNDREARTDLHASFMLASDGTSAAGRLGEFAATAAEERWAESQARTPPAIPDVPLAWGSGQTYPAAERHWEKEGVSRPGGMKVVGMSARYDDQRSRHYQLLITEGGTLLSRGKNCKHGQLGQFDPVVEAGEFGPVHGLEGMCVQQAVCGTVHALALTDDARVFAWGSDYEDLDNPSGARASDGRLGYATSRVPVTIPKEIEALRPEKRFQVNAPMPIFVRRKDIDAVIERESSRNLEDDDDLLVMWNQVVAYVEQGDTKRGGEKAGGSPVIDGFLSVQALKDAAVAMYRRLDGDETEATLLLQHLNLHVVPSELRPPAQIDELAAITLHGKRWLHVSGDRPEEVSDGMASVDFTDDEDLQWSAWVWQLDGSASRMSEILKRDNVVSISAGEKHSAALTDSGRLFCWGCGHDGRLGNGSELHQRAPAEPVEFVQPKWADSEAEALTQDRDGRRQVAQWLREHCAEDASTNAAIDAAAVVDDGSVLCTLYFNCRPFLKQERVVQVSCGNDFTLAISHSGHVYSWGYGECGQLGHGQEDDVSAQWSPRRVEALQQMIEQYGRVTQVACGEAHVLALTENASVIAWGESGNGQCGVRLGSDSSAAGAEDGYGSDENSATTTEDDTGSVVWQPRLIKEMLPSPSPGGIDARLDEAGVPLRMRCEPAIGDRVIQIAAGVEHSLALIDAGHILSWGKGDHGDGNGPLGNRLTPKEKREGCRAMPKLVTMAPRSNRDQGDFLFDMCVRLSDPSFQTCVCYLRLSRPIPAYSGVLCVLLSLVCGYCHAGMIATAWWRDLEFQSTQRRDLHRVLSTSLP